MAKRSFAGKRVVITGADSYLGWYLAVDLLRAGASLVASGTDAERLRQLRRAVGNPDRKLNIVPGSLSEIDHRRVLLQHAQQRFGGVDLLISLADMCPTGSLSTRPIDAYSASGLRDYLQQNFVAISEWTRLALPLMRWSKTPLTCFVLPKCSVAHHGHSSESQAARAIFTGWTRGLRREVKSAGIRVVNVAPTVYFPSRRTSATWPVALRSAENAARGVQRHLQHPRRTRWLAPLHDLAERLLRPALGGAGSSVWRWVDSRAS